MNYSCQCPATITGSNERKGSEMPAERGASPRLGAIRKAIVIVLVAVSVALVAFAAYQFIVFWPDPRNPLHDLHLR